MQWNWTGVINVDWIVIWVNFEYSENELVYWLERIIIGFNLNAMKLNRCNNCRVNSYMSQFVTAMKMK